MRPIPHDPHQTVDSCRPASRMSPDEVTVRSVTVLVATVVALTFIFGFGNVWTLGLRLGVPAWVAPLVAPAVDLSILGLLLGIRHLALNGATPEQLRPARRLLIFSSAVTLALNVADPLLAGMVGKAAFDAVGPFLLITWAEVGPGFLQAISETVEHTNGLDRVPELASSLNLPECRNANAMLDESELIERARREDERHWEMCRRPISAETLRKRMRVGAARSRTLVAIVRSERGTVIDPVNRHPAPTMAI
jgi:hypothetical protein